MKDKSSSRIGKRKAYGTWNWIGLDLFQVTMQLFRRSRLNWANVYFLFLLQFTKFDILREIVIKAVEVESILEKFATLDRMHFERRGERATGLPCAASQRQATDHLHLPLANTQRRGTGRLAMCKAT